MQKKSAAYGVGLPFIHNNYINKRCLVPVSVWFLALEHQRLPHARNALFWMSHPGIAITWSLVIVKRVVRL